MIIESLQQSDLDFAYQMVTAENWGYEKREITDLFKLQKCKAFIAKEDQQPIGMIFTVLYGKLAFIGNFIVRKDWRNKGVGTQLMEQTLKYLDKNYVKSITLDAVPQAMKLYEKFGFHRRCKSIRIKGIIKGKKHKSIRQMQPEDMKEVKKFDAHYFNADRKELLNQIYTKYPKLCYVLKKEQQKNDVQQMNEAQQKQDGQQIKGYIMAIPRKGYYKVGPWVIQLDVSHPEYFLESLNPDNSEYMVQWGMLENNLSGQNIIAQKGFKQYAYSIRMIKGKNVEFSPAIFAIAGPDRG